MGWASRLTRSVARARRWRLATRGARSSGLRRSLAPWKLNRTLLSDRRSVLPGALVGHDSSCFPLCPKVQLGELLRKEVIQPQVPLRLPCYDFTPVTDHSLVGPFLAVEVPTSGATDSHGVTGGVYKARERIHRCLLISDY